MLQNAKNLAGNSQADRRRGKVQSDHNVEVREGEVIGETHKENENLKSKLHEVRLRNAEYRSEI